MLIAARRGRVGVRVFAMVVISATGGGLLRDGLLLDSGTPAMLHHPVYIFIAVVASLLAMAFGSYVNCWRYLAASVRFANALGAGTYASRARRRLCRPIDPAAGSASNKVSHWR